VNSPEKISVFIPRQSMDAQETNHSQFFLVSFSHLQGSCQRLHTYLSCETFETSNSQICTQTYTQGMLMSTMMYYFSDS
jgi:hypothetical protein